MNIGPKCFALAGSKTERKITHAQMHRLQDPIPRGSELFFLLFMPACFTESHSSFIDFVK